MKADNDNKLPSFKTLDALPMFATDQEIAVAITGRRRAEHWRKNVLPILEARGFPRVDGLHQGRPVALIAHYYHNSYFGLGSGAAPSGADGEEDVSAWTRSRKSRRRG